MSKTKEIIFRRPCPVRFHLSLSFDSIEMVDHVKSLGVIIKQKLNFELYMSFLLKLCSQRMYLLRLLRSQGLSANHSHTVFHAIVVSRILYALQACGVFLNAGQSGRIDAILKRAYKCGFSKNLITTVTKLSTQSSTTLFREIKYNLSHCLSTLLPPKKSVNYSLRNCDFNYEPPQCTYTNHKQSFINHCLLNM